MREAAAYGLEDWVKNLIQCGVSTTTEDTV